jgi:HAD superfamily hydrolase (TIGR01509 family)
MITAKALLFDMDGTLVDSTPVVERTWHRFAQRHALDGHTILAKAHGCRTAETVALFAPSHVDIAQETARLIDEEIADVDGIAAVPGAAEFLQILPVHRWAVVTSASRELAIRRMTAAGLPIPPILIVAEDVQQGKPAPDGYLAAAQALRVPPSECLVFEDAPAGLAAAHAAAMRVFAVGIHSKTTKLHHEQWILDFTHLQIQLPLLDEDPIRLILTTDRR